MQDVAEKLKELAVLTKAQEAAIRNGNAELIEELHQQVQALVKAKGRAVEAWTGHHREHGC